MAIATTATPTEPQVSEHDWTKPAATAIPKEGYFELQNGRYGAVYPRTPACYGFTIIAKIKPGREEAIRSYGKTIEKAIAYVRFCASPQGGFGYQGPGQGPQTSAAGVLSLQLLGKYDDPSIPKTMQYLAGIPVQWGGGNPQYFYYFHYYALQAHYQYGGKEWNEWHPLVRELLLGKQNADGSWDLPPGTAEGEGSVGPNKVYWTAMACLVLDIYQHFLPAYQR